MILNKSAGIEDKAHELGEHIHNLVHHFLIKQHTSSNQWCETLNKQEMRVVEVLGKKGACIMSELAEQVMLAVSTLTGIIDSMVEKKLVSRERSEQDRRIVRVKLSDTGEDIFKAYEENHRKMSFGLLNSLNDTEQDTLISLFRKISDKIKSEDKVTVS